MNAARELHSGLLADIEECRKEIAATQQEIREIYYGTHPVYKERIAEFDQKVRDELEQIDILEELGTERIKNSLERKIEKAKKQLQNTLENGREELYKDAEECERMIELEFQTPDIGKTNNNYADVAKKTLRGRGGGTLIEPPTYFNAMPKPAVPSTPNVSYLLSEAEIAEDLALFATKKTDTNINKHKTEVSLSRMRLTYDGKTFKQGEEVSVESNEYKKFPARLESITETLVIFKATLSYDTRQIHASYSDLSEGRVSISKKRNN